MIALSERNKIVDNIMEIHGGDPSVATLLESLNGTSSIEFAALLEEIHSLFNEVSDEHSLENSLLVAIKDHRFQELVGNAEKTFSWDRKFAENVCVWLYLSSSLCAQEVIAAKTEEVKPPTPMWTPFLVCTGVMYALYFLVVTYL